MSKDRYDTSGNIEAQFEPGSNDSVLKNKLKIQSPAEMDEVELDLLIQLYDVLPDEIDYDQKITAADINEWHRRWLGNVYSWAGNYRTVNLGKADFHFAAAAQVDRLMNDFDQQYLKIHTLYRNVG